MLPTSMLMLLLLLLLLPPPQVRSTSAPAAKLHVESRGPRYVLADRLGRERLLNGINLATLGGGGSEVPIDPALYEGGKCPPNDPRWYQPPVCEADLADLAARGFDAIRLLVHWSQLEPEPGQYSGLYLDRVAQIIGWAAVRGVGVVIDFHQDNYAELSHACCANDGAPDWAWLVNSTKLTPAQRAEIAALSKLVPQLDWAGAGVAFYAFWHNHVVPQSGLGVQQHYIQAVAAMVNRTMVLDGVLGWELMNEPLPGLDVNLVGFSDKVLYPFYGRLVQAVTGVRDGLPSCPASDPISLAGDCAYPDLGLHTDRLIVCEPMAVRNQLDRSAQVSAPFTEYPNVVYAPHEYTRSFTLSKNISFNVSLDTAAREAYKMRAAVLVTEWGGGALADLLQIGAEQQAHRVSGLHWVWKQNGDGGWGLFSATNGGNFSIRTDRLRATSRIRPRAVAGELLAYRSSGGGGGDGPLFWMRGYCNRTIAAPTEIYVPAHFAECAATIRANGTASVQQVVRRTDGSAVVLLGCSSDGEFEARCDVADAPASSLFGQPSDRLQ